MRKIFIAANWKMFKTLEESYVFVKKFLKEYKSADENKQVVISPPATNINLLSKVLEKSDIKVGAQDCSMEDEGAYTGDISAKMIKSVGAAYVIVGHSERRKYHDEDDVIVGKKIKKVISEGMTPIYCCGEKKEDRDSGKHADVVAEQLTKAIFPLGEEEAKSLIIAYEPVWAIGTGKNATPDEAEEMHKFIRGKMEERYSKDVAENIRIIYGGSVNPDNSSAILSKENIDGFLVGGASLEVDKFKKILESV